MKKITPADMCNGPLFFKIIRYTVPVMLSGILQLLFNAADLVVVGRFCGKVSVAAVGATSSLINLLVNLFIGLSVGCGICVAQGLGAGDSEAVRKTIHTAVPTAVVSGFVLTVTGVMFSDDFLSFMGTPYDVIDLATIYMRIYFCGMVFSMVYNYCAAILRAKGNTRSPLLFLVIAGTVNVVFNVFFVTVFDMNVAGVALASAISQALSAVLAVISLVKCKDECHLSLKNMKIYKENLIKMIKIGLPAGLQGSLFSISNVIIQSSVNSFGSVVMSGNAAAQSIEGFVYTSMNAFHQTALNFTGQNYGAKKPDRIKKILRICLLSVTVTGLFMGVFAYLLAKPLLSIYIKDSVEAIGYGTTRLLYISVPYFFCGIMDVVTGALRGMGSSVPPMLITVMGVCVFRIGWIFTVFARPEFHILDCLYISYPISWLLTFVAELILYAVVLSKYRKKTEKEKILVNK